MVIPGVENIVFRSGALRSSTTLQRFPRHCTPKKRITRASKQKIKVMTAVHIFITTAVKTKAPVLPDRGTSNGAFGTFLEADFTVQFQYRSEHCAPVTAKTSVQDVERNKSSHVPQIRAIHVATNIRMVGQSIARNSTTAWFALKAPGEGCMSRFRLNRTLL